LWRSSMQQGDIPGTYWALLTHPAVTHALVRRAFGEVHMLSHLVGAANRADIRRLSQLEEELAAVSAKLQRQEIQLREAVVSRDTKLQNLQRELANRIADNHKPGAGEGWGALHVLEGCVATLEHRLGTERRRNVAAPRRLAATREELERERKTRIRAEQAVAQLSMEVAAVEATLLPARAEGDSPPIRLDGTTLLYVGGRTHHMPCLREIAEEMGAVFLRHDGGVEETTATLAGLVARADLVLFPVDCVSHDAALQVKRLCRHQGKPFRALRSSGASSLLAALSEAF
jgi:hypothetical protein